MDISRHFSGAAGQVWRYFENISAIPRPSRHEERIRAWLIDHARAQGWEVREDATGNVVFALAGRGLLADAPMLIVQGHMDMVCEKNSHVEHDFMKDPIRLRTDGEWIRAVDTTLGADNGIAIALALALAEEEMADRVPLELLFTIDEETGLTGAMGLDPLLVKGKRLLNLDSEVFGVFTIGCAGGQDVSITLALGEEVAEARACFCQVRGLLGGHSGVNIHENRGNAIRIAAGILSELYQLHPDIQLVEFEGGNKRNAIPREAHFKVIGCDERDLLRLTEPTAAGLCRQEPGIRIQVDGCAVNSARVIPRAFTEMILALPNGVLAMDPVFHGLVQTSCNTSVARGRQEAQEILMHCRSSVEQEKREMASKIQAIAAEFGARCTLNPGYPGWTPNPDSTLLADARRIHLQLFGEEAKVNSMHAGLEAGIIGTMIGSTECLSYGPNVLDPHSPDERLHVETTEKLFEWLKALAGMKS